MTMRTLLLAACAAVSLATTAQAAPPAAIFTDPPADAANPARSAVLHIPSGGVEINGLAYVAAGPGSHPTVVLLHGLPGNEKNLDLAQVMRRAGWNVVTFNYRGSWGSPGSFSFKGNLADAKAVLAYVQTPEVARELQIDVDRLVMIGHSMGGWVTAMTAADSSDLMGAALISAADMGTRGALPMDRNTAVASQNMESLAGVTAQSTAQEMSELGAYTFAAAASGLANKRLLVLSSDDGLAPMTDALVADIRKRGGTGVTAVHAATDHGWNTQRVRLATEILAWLDKLPK